jgi:malonate decarboxylase gamma subunit
MKWREVAERLFPEGHAIAQTGDVLSGIGVCKATTFAVTGTADHAEVGIEACLAMAQAVLACVRLHPARPILFLIDTQGQRLRWRDEMLGIQRYMAHLATCVEVARMRGHPLLGLVYDQALSGGILPSAMCADVCGALPDAEIRVMNLTAMARVTRIDESRLRELSLSSPVFAPGALHFVQMGAVESIWDGDLSQMLRAALAAADPRDRRAERGLARGGRLRAFPVAERIVNDD